MGECLEYEEQESLVKIESFVVTFLRLSMNESQNHLKGWISSLKQFIHSPNIL